MRWGVLLVGLAVFGVGVASANVAPLANAGLDQEVDRNTTVYLDARGSTDPDGSITGYEWRITTPNGSDMRPDCVTCEQTKFVPTEVGQYNVTVEVTDDDGATREDTLHVVVERARPPSVTVSGPTDVNPGDTRTYQALATAGDANLSTVSWRVDGSHRAHVAVGGDTASLTRDLSFPEGDHTVTVVVIDMSGKRESDELTVQATTGSPPGGGGGPPPALSTDGSGDGIIQYDAESDTWSVDTDLASRVDGAVEVGDAVVTTEKLEGIDSSQGVIRAFEDAGTSEETMIRAAAQGKNNFEATGEGSLDTIDNSFGQVECDVCGESTSDDSDGSSSTPSWQFSGGYAGERDDGSGSSGSGDYGTTSDGDSGGNSGGERGCSTCSGGAGF